jgi:hypothetical protein
MTLKLTGRDLHDINAIAFTINESLEFSKFEELSIIKAGFNDFSLEFILHYKEDKSKFKKKLKEKFKYKYIITKIYITIYKRIYGSDKLKTISYLECSDNKIIIT